MRGRRRTCSVGDTRILVQTIRADDSPVFVLFLIVSDRIRTITSRAPKVDYNLDEVPSGTIFGLDCRL